MCSSRARQFTVITKFGLPILYVRRAVPANGYGDLEWSAWRMAKPGEIIMAIVKLQELSVN